MSYKKLKPMDNEKPPEKIKDGGGKQHPSNPACPCKSCKKTSTTVTQLPNAHYVMTTIAHIVSVWPQKSTKHLTRSTERTCGGLANNAYQHWWP